MAFNLRFPRREFLKFGAKTGVAWSTLTFLQGCGGSDNLVQNLTPGAASSPDSAMVDLPDIPTQTVRGFVDRSVVGGEGLSVSNSTTAPVAVAPDGGFVIEASTLGPQILFVKDIQANIRALAVLCPPPDGEDWGVIAVDALSTSIGILFLTPGFATGDRDEGRIRIAQVSGSPKMSEVVSSLRLLMPDLPLSELIGVGDLQSKLADLLNSWTVSNQVLGQTLNQSTVRGSVTGADEVTLENYAWRWVSVVRRKADAAGDSLETTAPRLTDTKESHLFSRPNLIPGANALSFGSLFTAGVGAAAGVFDRVDLDAPEGVSAVSYWVYGPGFLAGQEPPDDVRISDFDAEWVQGLSFVNYVLFPVIEPVLGIGSALNGALKAVEAVWSLLVSRGLNIATLVSAFGSDDQNGLVSGVVSVVIDLLVGAIPFALELAVLLFEGSALAAAAPVLGVVLAGALGVMSAVNLTMAVGDWTRLPRLFEVPLDPSDFSIQFLMDIREIANPVVNDRLDSAWAEGSEVGDPILVANTAEGGTRTVLDEPGVGPLLYGLTNERWLGYEQDNGGLLRHWILNLDTGAKIQLAHSVQRIFPSGMGWYEGTDGMTYIFDAHDTVSPPVVFDFVSLISESELAPGSVNLVTIRGVNRAGQILGSAEIPTATGGSEIVFYFDPTTPNEPTFSIMPLDYELYSTVGFWSSLLENGDALVGMRLKLGVTDDTFPDARVWRPGVGFIRDVHGVTGHNSFVGMNSEGTVLGSYFEPEVHFGAVLYHLDGTVYSLDRRPTLVHPSRPEEELTGIPLKISETGVVQFLAVTGDRPTQTGAVATLTPTFS